MWEDDANTAARVDELLRGYAGHDIPVRSIILDSPWSTRYNDFIIDTLRYPQPEEWFHRLQNDGYRVVLWMTSMVNSDNKDTKIKNARAWFDVVKKQGFLTGIGNQVNWWKGRGGFIDYSNPAALQWWRARQEKIFDYGIDGWKLDGTATFFSSKYSGVSLPYGKTFSGRITTRQYMDLYYREEFRHGVQRNPEFVTLARALDGDYIHPEGFAPIDAAPVTWVGDQEHIWQAADCETVFADKIFGGSEGLETAIRDVLNSAKLGYNIIGSDIAGFSGREIPPRLYIRWAQFSTFCGLFLNGGHGERALWKRSPQELEIIRKFSWLHTELVPYMYSYVVSAHEGRQVLQRPTGQGYHYLFGDDFLVAPIFRDSLEKTVYLPPGKWHYLFDDREVIAGGSILQRSFPLDEFPVFVRDGAIVPLAIERPYSGFGDQSSIGFTTWLIYPEGKNQFTRNYPGDSAATTVIVEKKEHELSIRFSGRQTPHILLISAEEIPESVALDGRILTPGSDWFFNTAKQRIRIKTEFYKNCNYRIVF